MNLRYEKLRYRGRLFIRLTGVSQEVFSRIIKALAPEWEKLEAQRKSPSGRRMNLETLEDRVLVVLMYYRTYITHEFLGYLFGLHNSNISRLLSKLEPIMAKKITIKKDPRLTAEKILELLVDVTEQPIERPKRRKNTGKRTPKNRQKRFYSGKKKRHTIKHEIAVTPDGRIISVSQSFPGRTHDYRIRKESCPLPAAESTLADSGYQGYQKIRPGVLLPRKSTKLKPLTFDDKVYNKALSSRRVVVENVIGKLKRNKILKETYRNKGTKHNLRFNIIAGIHNLHVDFASA
jgi:hypothetical protein